MSRHNIAHFKYKDKGYSNYSLHSMLPRHRWYLYKEGFSTHFVREAIESSQLVSNDVILDPFNGSGTTTLTAASLGIKAVGIEVNPFTSFLAATKMLNVSAKVISEVGNKLMSPMKDGRKSPLSGFSTFSPKTSIDKWLFNEEVLKSFEGGWFEVAKFENSKIRDLMRLSLIISAMKNCNAKKDGKCLRYHTGWYSRGYNKSSFIDSFYEALDMIKEDVRSSVVAIKAKIIQGDCRSVLASMSVGAFKLCITSPPYLNTFDYTDIYRPELFLGKFVNDNTQLYELRMKTVRSHIQSSWGLPYRKDFGAVYTKTMRYILDNSENLMSPRIPSMIQAYFEDMYNILSQLHRIAKPEAQVWFVVSNSAYANYEIPVDLILGDIGTQAGWFLKEIGVLRYIKKRKTSKSVDVVDLRESVIIFSNSK